MTRLISLLLIVGATGGVGVALAAADPYQTRFPASQSTHAAGGGDVYIRARCPWSADDGCGGDVRLAEAVGEFATGEAYTPREPFYLQPGQRGWLVVQLTRRAMRRLERRGRLEARIVVYPSHRHGPPNQGGEVDVLPPCPGASEFSSGC